MVATDRAARIAALVSGGLVDDDVTDLQLVDAMIGAIDDGLDRIDSDGLLGPGEQVAVLVVSLTRAFAPFLRDQAERMIADAESKAAKRAEVAAR